MEETGIKTDLKKKEEEEGQGGDERGTSRFGGN